MDRYIKGEVLGEGTFGVVFKATHKEVCQEHFMPTDEQPLSHRASAPSTLLLSCFADRPGRCHQEDQAGKGQ